MEPYLGNLFLQILNLKGHLGARIPLLNQYLLGFFSQPAGVWSLCSSDPSASGRLRTRALVEAVDVFSVVKKLSQQKIALSFDIKIPPEKVFWLYFGGSKCLLNRCFDV